MNVQVIKKVLSTSRSARDAFSLAGRRTAGVKWRLALPAIAVLAAACVVASGDNTPTAPSLTSAPAALTSAPERPAVFTSASFIVKLANGLSADEQQAVIARNGGTETASVAALRLHTIETSGDTLDQIIKNYQSEHKQRPEAIKVDALRAPRLQMLRIPINGRCPRSAGTRSMEPCRLPAQRRSQS